MRHIELYLYKVTLIFNYRNKTLESQSRGARLLGSVNQSGLHSTHTASSTACTEISPPQKDGQVFETKAVTWYICSSRTSHSADLQRRDTLSSHWWNKKCLLPKKVTSNKKTTSHCIRNPDCTNICEHSHMHTPKMWEIHFGRKDDLEPHLRTDNMTILKATLSMYGCWK